MTGDPEPSPPVARVERGALLAYRVFDTGDTIDLARVEASVAGASKVDLGGPLAEGLVIPARPVEIPLGTTELALPGAPADFPLVAKVYAHLFDFGALTIIHEIPLPEGTSFAALTPLCDVFYDAPALDDLGVAKRNELVARLGGAVEKPHAWVEAETYTILFIEALGGTTADALRGSPEAAKLLLGETSRRALSSATREDVTKNCFSYLEGDLVVVDWNSAIVVEPSGSRVVANVLELATCQLLELRYYDRLLDAELARVYEHVERARPRILRSPYGALTRQVLRRFMELTELTERVDNAIKSVGDFYLARVYQAAIVRFRVDHWRESVEAKLELVGKAYELLKGEVEVTRSQGLEVIVVILILIELLTALRGH